HFLEHMCFNGTKNFPGNGVITYLESIGVKFGAQLNAYTSVDETVYNINNVPTGRETTIDSVLLILHDWSHDLTLATEEIDKERGVIHEEWRTRSSATMRIFERQLPKLMSNSRPGNRLPIGTMEVIDNFKPEVLRAYYERWYRPDQQAIIVVGDLDIDHVEKAIKEMFGPIPMPVNPAERVYYGVEDNKEPIVVCDHDKEQTLPIVLVMSKHPDLTPREYHNTMPYLTTKLLMGAATSMLNQRLNELSLDPSCPYLQASVDDGNFLLSGETQCVEITIIPKEDKVNEAVTIVMQEVYRAVNHGFTATEYGRWRNEFLSQVQALYDNKDKREHPSFIQECVKHFIQNEPMPGLEMEYQLYNAMLPQVPVEAVNQVFAQLMSKDDTNLVVLSMNPEKEGFVQPNEAKMLEAIHAAQQANLPAYEDNVKNEPLIAKLPKLGKIKKQQVGPFGSTILMLGNGVRVIMKPTDYKDNEIVMQAYSNGGTARYSEEDKYTLSMLSQLVGASGLGEFTDTELQKALAGVQASVNPSIGRRTEKLTGTAVPKDLRTLFELIYLHFQPLKRDDKAVASVMQQMAESLRNREANPLQAFSDTISTTMYGHNSQFVLMKEPDLEKVSYDRALEIYQDRFADASDFTFVFVGSFDPDSIRYFSQQYLANLPKVRRNDSPVDDNYNIRTGKHEKVFAKKMTQPQCRMLMLLTSPVKNTLKNEIATDMVGQILSMRLLETIREEMGAAYSVGALGVFVPTSSGDFSAALQIQAPVKPELVDTCRQVIDQELKALATNGAEEKYIQKVKEYLLKSFKENDRDNSAWLEWLMSMDYYNADKYTGYEAIVQNLKSEDIRKAAAQLLEAGNAITVVITPEQ
ncbi:MAG: insulinase family protein, partial [Bacteroidaceae bacterium]|nr:insulinase family protein [Bacteroidaceae bacterium]